MAGIAHLVRIRASPESVYRLVATTEGIAEWFTEASSADYREGGTLELRFSGEPVSFAVTELTEPSRIVWRCTSEENSWFDTEIAFEFEAEGVGEGSGEAEGEGDRTVVRFDHLGWPEVTDRFRDCSTSWAYFLESLKSLIEEGRGTPESVAPDCEGSPLGSR
jgi:uncharacterized protein YndB with AHSA1/START domain